MPDIVNLIIWLIAGVAGGNAAGELLKGDYDLGPGNTVAGAIGGVVGALILQALIPALRGIDYGPIIGQLIVAAASGAVLTVIAGAVQSSPALKPTRDLFRPCWLARACDARAIGNPVPEPQSCSFSAAFSERLVNTEAVEARISLGEQASMPARYSASVDPRRQRRSMSGGALDVGALVRSENNSSPLTWSSVFFARFKATPDKG